MSSVFGLSNIHDLDDRQYALMQDFWELKRKKNKSSEDIKKLKELERLIQNQIGFKPGTY